MSDCNTMYMCAKTQMCKYAQLMKRRDANIVAYSCVKGKNQLDATYFIIYSILIHCSTCFGR